MKKYFVAGLSFIVFSSVGLQNMTVFAESQVIKEEGTVKSEDISQEDIEKIDNVTAKDVVEHAKKLGYNPELIWTRQELQEAYQSIQTRAGVNRLITMSNDLKYLYMSSFTAKLALSGGAAAVAALFPGIGVSIIAAAVTIIVAERINLYRGIIVRLSRNKTTNLLVPTAVWQQG
ncbi:hypothetical protein [Enterococcus faecium]|uniref:hypothetical protein n=1 Tax=Enterococcus faecium TaxID=1352 RepID=UPI0023B26669|nr:hypothetical protein [Enterococcus faecium]